MHVLHHQSRDVIQDLLGIVQIRQSQRFGRLAVPWDRCCLDAELSLDQTA